ncbi:putative malonate transporter, MdcF, AEC family [Candidatus Terasakiella magnetica]|uniref:Putative malonate transporter, MdcF, AEC family n=1 Tax=Candidatus Terasakiella magnetica TaxID=1867952 RepID=A0A1C3REQ5_9PROT|nr:AEC family transporter [Candidatus Terasakiella magnetica]SCA55767.1 putative malonate transporter, MdcF, AEC family [Candidatus Terasakiella magnetica]
MSDIGTIILPVFALIALGYLMVKRGLFSQSGVDDLTRFIFYLAVPALLFRTSASGVMTQKLELSILAAFFGMGVFILFGCYFLMRKIGHERSVVVGISACFSNLALIALPIVQTAYPPEALVPLMTLITFNAMVLFTLPCIMIETGRNPNASILAIFTGAIKTVLSNPLVIALVSGWIFSETGSELPQVIDRITELLSKAAAPCALFAVGGGMARYSLRLEETKAPVLLVTFAKLILMPAGVWLICTYIVGTSPLWTMIATLGAAMPTGANPFVFATRYGVGDRIAGNAILLSTALSLITLSAFLLIFPSP